MPVLLKAQRPPDDPSLIYCHDSLLPDRNNPSGDPFLHVLLVGVSEYAEGGFKPLSSTANSIWLIYEWLMQQEAKGLLCARLGTIRMLLSPGPDEPGDAITAKRQLELPDVLQDNLDDAVHRWVENASKREKDFTFFYYAGHGVQCNTSDQTLLMNDFQGEDRFQRRTVAFPSIQAGMIPTNSEPIKAGTQFYFVDACRDMPQLINRFDNISSGIIFPTPKSRASQKFVAPVFFAALPGGTAQAISGRQTLFSMALLRALNGEAAQPKSLIEADDRKYKWHVSYSSLNVCLGEILNEINTEYKGHQDWITSGFGDDAPICYFDVPPPVEVSIEVAPPEAVSGVTVRLLLPKFISSLLTLEEVCKFQIPPKTHPFVQSLAPSNYMLEAMCNGYDLFTDNQISVRPIGGRRFMASLTPTAPSLTIVPMTDPVVNGGNT